MELILDNQTKEVTENDTDTLRDVIERLSEELKHQNRVISEIYIDGKQIGGWDDPEVANMQIGSCNHLRIMSEEPRKLAHNVLYDIAEYMPKLQEALVETSRKIQSRQEQEGLMLLEQVTATWAELLQGLQSAIIVTGIDLDHISVNGKPFADINEEIHGFLDEASNLVQTQQNLELSDILEYEIAPRMPLVEEAIHQMIKAVEQKPH